MRKRSILIFSFALLLLLAGCGSATPSESLDSGAAKKVPAEPPKEELSLVLEETSYSEDYESGGVRLAALRLSYPKLTVVTADGEEYIGPETETVDGVTRYLGAVGVAKNFNAEMAAAMQEKREAFNTMCSDAQSHYDSLEPKYREYWGGYAMELNCASFQSGALISTVGTGYWHTGGAHPTSFHETWNYDLDTGEFFTYEQLAADASALHRAVADEVVRQIYAQRLNEAYFEDFESIVRDLAYTHMSFDGEGMTVYFDEYTLGPHAAGVPVFTVACDKFCEYLSERGREVLSVPREAYVLSSFAAAQELWSYFHMTTIPLDYDAPVVEQDGMTYRRVKHGDITTLAQLKSLLCEYVSEEIADEWLSRSPDRFREFDGVLYCFEADRGSGMEYGNPRYAVVLDGNAGVLTMTLDEYDTEHWDEQTNDFPVKGELEIEYPFTMNGYRAVFESFECVW